jgi:hypothetical protein
MKLQCNNIILEVSAVFAGVDTPSWAIVEINRYEKKKFFVKIERVDLRDKTRRAIFPFWDNMQAESPTPSDSTLKSAFSCFFRDAMAYFNAQDILDFADEFGYDLSDEKAKDQCRKAYEGCKNAYDKMFEKLGLDCDDFQAFLELEELQDY